jgi:8-oxo-dGTP pyrophosphatase MutT (NUDIX family)
MPAITLTELCGLDAGAFDRYLTPVVSCVLYDNNGVWLNRRAFTKSYPGQYQCPGGKVEKDEDLETALEREIYEETGVFIPRKRFHFVDEIWIDGTDRLGGYYVSLYRAELLKGEVLKNPEPDKQTDWECFSVAGMHQLALDKKLIPALNGLVNLMCL